MLSLDSVTRAEYDALYTASARAQAVISALAAPVTVSAYNGSGTLMGQGTMQSPWATQVNGTLTVAELQSFTVLQAGTPDAASWYLRFESGLRWLRGTLGPGGDFTSSVAAWEAGQPATLGTITMQTTDVQTAPIWATVPPITTAAGVETPLAGYASDPNGGVLTFELVSGPGAVSTSGVYTMGSTSGSIVVRVTDPTGLTADTTVAVTVQAAGDWTITEAFDDATLAWPWYDYEDTPITVAAMPGTANNAFRSTWGAGISNGATTGGGGRIQFTPTDELWFKARVWMDATLRDGHLFYFKLSSAGIYEAPGDQTPPDPDHGTFYVEMGTNGTTGLLTFDTRREDGTNWDTQRYTTKVIADGQPHDLTFRFVLNTAGQADGIIQAWDGTTQVANYTNWRFRETAGSKFSYMILGPYRQGDAAGAAELYVDNLSLSNAGSVPVAPPTVDDYTFRSPLPTDRYLDPQVGADGTGTEASPWNSISAAKLSTLVAGQALWIKNGTVTINGLDQRYSPLAHGTAQNRITVSAYPGHAPTLLFQTYWVASGNYWDFRGLNFQLVTNLANGFIFGTTGMSGPEAQSTGFRIIDCTGTKTMNVYSDNAGIINFGGNTDYAEIIRCTFTDNGTYSGPNNNALIWTSAGNKHLKITGCLLTSPSLPIYYKHNHGVSDPNLVDIEVRNCILRGGNVRPILNCAKYVKWINNVFECSVVLDDVGGPASGDYNQFHHNTFNNASLGIGYCNADTPLGSIGNILRNNVFANGARISDNPYGAAGNFDNQTDTQYNCFHTGSIYSRNSVSNWTLSTYRTAFPTKEQNSISGAIAFVGGSNPGTTPANWALAVGSTGKGAASDGTDMGVDATKLLTVN